MGPHELAIRRCMTALADIRLEAGWLAERLRPTSPLDRKRHGALALRLFELARDGEPDPEAVIVAVFKAKVHQQRKKDGEHGAGNYATAKSICSGEWWDANLLAGRAWLASGGRPTAPVMKRGGAFTPRGEYDTV